MTPSEITQSLQKQAKAYGFELFGTCPAVKPTGFSDLVHWIDAGYAGEMQYFEDRKQAYSDPNHVLDGVTGIVMLGMNYQTARPSPTQPGQARVARYAWGDGDYHDLIHQRLKQLKKYATQLVPNALVRGVVDTAPLLEREFAQLAGIGWSAKNTMLISKTHGSWFLLAGLLVNFPLHFDLPFVADHCGTCTACMDACPTDAFVRPHQLDATQCISYLTIEHRSPIPEHLREGVGDWLFGCDVCQEVCPWNSKATLATEPFFQPRSEINPFNVRDLFSIDEDEFRVRFRKTPMWRAKRRGLVRNAAIVLGNQPHPDNVPPLILGLNDCEPLVRGASAWALGRQPTADAGEILTNRQRIVEDPIVREELTAALAAAKSSS